MIIFRQKLYATGAERAMIAMNKLNPPKTNKTAIRQLDHSIPYKKAEIENKMITFIPRFKRGFYASRLENSPRQKKHKILKEIAENDAEIKNRTKTKHQILKEIAKSKRDKEEKKILDRLELDNALMGGREGITKYAGKKVNDFVDMASENPISAAGIGFGYGSTPIQVAAGQYWGPIGSASLGAERVLKGMYPGYRKGTKKLSKLMKKHKIGQKAGAIVQGALNSIPV